MSAAVKLALGETQIIQDTKAFLEENGVCLDAFNQVSFTYPSHVSSEKRYIVRSWLHLMYSRQAPQQRSRTIILVKNLPAQTKSDDIREMFAKHGELGRIVLPPSGITGIAIVVVARTLSARNIFNISFPAFPALVEFLEPSEARKAFTRLAYTKYKHLPLYLEWAPDNSFTAPASKRNASKGKVTGSSISKEAKEGPATQKSRENSVRKKAAADEDDEEPEPDTTLFVKNINFSTTTEQLKSVSDWKLSRSCCIIMRRLSSLTGLKRVINVSLHFQYFAKCGRLHYITIATKKDPKNSSNNLPMGYGFVRYKRKHDADRALKTLQMTVLDGKSLELKRSERILTYVISVSSH